MTGQRALESRRQIQTFGNQSEQCRGGVKENEGENKFIKQGRSVWGVYYT